MLAAAVAAAAWAAASGAAAAPPLRPEVSSDVSAKYFALALAQQKLNQLPEAEAAYERAVLADAGDFPAGLRQKVALYGEVLQWQGKAAAAREVYAAAVQSGLLHRTWERPLVPVTAAEGAGPAGVGRASAFYDEEEVRGMPRLASIRQRLQESAAEVRAEYFAWRAAHPELVRQHSDALVALPQEGWAQLPLDGGGLGGRASRARDCGGLCPRTAALMQEVQEELCYGETCPRRAEFSVLRAGAWLRPHCGPTTLSLTLHLGLVCPRPETLAEVADDGAARFCVGGECRQWREGELLIFNEAVEHEAFGPSSGDRVVLLLKVPHPALPRDVFERLYSEYLGNSSLLEAVRSAGEALLLRELSGGP